VTAAGQGIGYASVMAMVAEGATVWATDVNPTLLERLNVHASIHTHVLDVMDKAAIKALAAKIPTIDALFNCAGFVHAGTVLEATDDDWNVAILDDSSLPSRHARQEKRQHHQYG
jgi:2-keto-3-deoxy-L-fuconate dehydrogenase